MIRPTPKPRHDPENPSNRLKLMYSPRNGASIELLLGGMRARPHLALRYEGRKHLPWKENHIWWHHILLAQRRPHQIIRLAQFHSWSTITHRSQSKRPASRNGSLRTTQGLPAELRLARPPRKWRLKLAKMQEIQVNSKASLHRGLAQDYAAGTDLVRCQCYSKDCEGDEASMCLKIFSRQPITRCLDALRELPYLGKSHLALTTRVLIDA